MRAISVLSTSLLFLFCLLVLSCTSATSAIHTNNDIDSVIVDLTHASAGLPIEGDAVGISLEMDNAYLMTGISPNLRQPFLSLMAQLAIAANSPNGPPIRIGANSVEHGWFDPDGKDPLPHNITYRVQPIWLESFSQVATALNSKLVLGSTFLEPHNASMATDFFAGVDSTISYDALFAAEIGNEPDDFYYNGMRSFNFSLQDYTVQIAEYEQSIWSLASPPPDQYIQCLTAGQKPWSAHTWIPDMATFFARNGHRCKTVSYHVYPLTNCGGVRTTMDHMLSNAAISGNALPYSPFIQQVREVYGLDFWLGELNSISCGGQSGISDAFGASLWALDYLFTFAALGVRGFNFHSGSSSPYSMFSFSSLDPTTPPQVMALYYGIYAFNLASGTNSHLLNDLAINSSNVNISLWATVAPSRFSSSPGQLAINVIVIDRRLDDTEPAHVRITGAAMSSFGLFSEDGSTSLQAAKLVLSAPSAYSKNEINISGLTWDGTKDGSPTGELKPEFIEQQNDGSFEFDIEPVSAVIFSISLI